MITHKLSPLFLSILICTGTLAQARRAPRVVDYSVLLVPSRHGAVQIGRDMEARENILLMSYDPEASADDLFIHAWDGETWRHVPANNFAAGAFVQTQPLRVIVVGPPTPVVSKLVEKSSTWARREVLNLESEDAAEFINAMGRIFRFKPRDWRWFAARYTLDLEDLNKDSEHISWYDMYRASDLPPPTSPFGRRRETEPETGLRPIIRVEDVPEREPPQESEDDGEGFSFDLE
ncbi:MAG: hypothetical protein JJU29_11795 [Verrucomicrobia bacterium]|nr:hypothetical protein [Verrucomicrobiota bacterium]